MLYITTRDNKDAFTAHHALIEMQAVDGGGYVPFQIPHFDETEILAFRDKPFGQIIAEILNLFFTSHLTAWDIDCCIGRNTFKINTIHHRIAIAELWYNPKANYEYIVDSLYRKVVPNSESNPSEWFRIAIRIAVLFGIFAQMQGFYTI